MTIGELSSLSAGVIDLEEGIIEVRKVRERESKTIGAADGWSNKRRTYSYPGYYEWCRQDILLNVPPEAGTVLSVGCGAGATERILVEDGRRVVGIEVNSEAAARARQRGLEVIEGDVYAVTNDLQDYTFDCIIYADVLEHLPTPEKILREHMQFLAPAGCVIISVPNFRHYSVFLALARGEFPYSDSGIFDRSHLRITTRRGVARWCEDAGLKVQRYELIIMRRREKIASVLTLGLLKEFVAKQVLCVCRRVAP